MGSPHASIGYRAPNLEVFVPATAAMPAAPCSPACLDRLSVAWPGSVCACTRRMAGCATPTRCAGHAPAGNSAERTTQSAPVKVCGDCAHRNGVLSQLTSTTYYE
jgi:hypothetical protein